MLAGGVATKLTVTGLMVGVLFRAVDKQDRTVDFLLTYRRNAKELGISWRRP